MQEEIAWLTDLQKNDPNRRRTQYSRRYAEEWRLARGMGRALPSDRTRKVNVMGAKNRSQGSVSLRGH